MLQAMARYCPVSTFPAQNSARDGPSPFWTVLHVNVFPNCNFLVAQSPCHQMATLGERCYLYYNHTLYAAQIVAVKEFRVSRVMVVVFISDLLHFVPMSIPYHLFDLGVFSANIRRYWWDAWLIHDDSDQLAGMSFILFFAHFAVLSNQKPGGRHGVLVLCSGGICWYNFLTLLCCGCFADSCMFLVIDTVPDLGPLCLVPSDVSESGSVHSESRSS